MYRAKNSKTIPLCHKITTGFNDSTESETWREHNQVEQQQKRKKTPGDRKYDSSRIGAQVLRKNGKINKFLVQTSPRRPRRKTSLLCLLPSASPGSWIPQLLVTVIRTSLPSSQWNQLCPRIFVEQKKLPHLYWYHPPPHKFSYVFVLACLCACTVLCQPPT